jgi:predicted DCC family thiol-disulfide oxidoreductase YuxK
MIPTLIYDANCRLCESTKGWVARWGRHRPLRILHFENQEACILQPDLQGTEYLDAIRFIDDNGKVWKGAQGVIHLIRILPFGRPVAWMLTLPGGYRLAERTYWWVARNRYRMFGRTN